MRTRGRFSVATNAVDTNIQGAFGAVVVSDAAFAAGVASCPTPVTEANDQGWVVWEGFQWQAQGSLTTAGPKSIEFEFDSKGMRKLPVGFTYAFLVENATANSFDFAFTVSSLFKQTAG